MNPAQFNFLIVMTCVALFFAGIFSMVFFFKRRRMVHCRAVIRHEIKLSSADLAAMRDEAVQGSMKNSTDLHFGGKVIVAQEGMISRVSLTLEHDGRETHTSTLLPTAMFSKMRKKVAPHSIIGQSFPAYFDPKQPSEIYTEAYFRWRIYYVPAMLVVFPIIYGNLPESVQVGISRMRSFRGY